MARVLIVDDEKSIRITLKELLKRDNHKISLAESAQKCLSLLEEKNIDVVVSDIILPDMSGIELLRKIHVTYPEIQVVMITGQPTLETATEALRAGAIDYLQKPIAAVAISKVVSNAFRIKQLVDRKERLEIENRQYQQNLEEMVLKKTSELQASYLKLEQEVAEKEKAQEELHLRVIALESAANAVVITDREGTIIWINRAFSELTGYSYDDAIGQNPRVLKSGSHIQSFYEEMWITITSGQVWHGEVTNKRKDGSTYIEEMTITPVKNSAGQIENYIAIKDDISARKQLEAQFHQAQKMESIGTLAGGIAHDFNNLLTIINGYADISIQEMDSNAPLFGNIKAIKNAGIKAEYMTRQLLAFSRKQIFQPKIVDLNKLIFNQDKMLRRLIGENIRITMELNEQAVTIKADPGQIEQVFMNLVINARDAINDKEQVTSQKQITIKTGQIWLDNEYNMGETGGQVGTHAFFSVGDTGVGMEKEITAKIFEPFFSTKAEGKGTGLGLSTVYGIVKQNGGSLQVQSKPGEGTVFKIFWPLVDHSEFEEVLSGENTNIPSGKESILLVEDDQGLREFTLRALQNMGYTTYAAANGRLALELYKQKKLNSKISLLLTDIVMPEMGGYELAKELSHLHSELKVLYSSGHTDEQIVESGKLKDGIDFIQKPFSVAELATRIREVLDGIQGGDVS